MSIGEPKIKMLPLGQYGGTTVSDKEGHRHRIWNLGHLNGIARVDHGSVCAWHHETSTQHVEIEEHGYKGGMGPALERCTGYSRHTQYFENF